MILGSIMVDRSLQGTWKHGIKRPVALRRYYRYSCRRQVRETRRFVRCSHIWRLISDVSDTIGFTLTLVFYYLALKPTYQTLIRDEISSGPLPSDVQSLQTLPILQSIINETLRLHPPVPTYASRITGPEGLTIGGEYIPPHTTTCTSKYTIARRKCFWSVEIEIKSLQALRSLLILCEVETAFERPNEFIPERWTTKPEMVRDKRAFAPFSQGEDRRFLVV